MTDVTRTVAIVLAGGRGLRMGGVDKAWLHWHGAALIESVCACLRDQVDDIVVAAHGDATRYAMLGLRCVSDLRSGWLGPLAGLEAGMQASDAPWLLSVPVDVPRLPRDLRACLAAAAEGHDGARASDADGAQPLIALYRREAIRVSLPAVLNAGERAVHRWQASLDLGMHDWSPSCFGNLNTPADLAREQDMS